MKAINLSLFRKILNNQRGQVLPMVALGMVGLVGMAGMTIDVGNAYAVRNELQNSVNAAALASAGAVYKADNLNLAQSEANTFLNLNAGNIAMANSVTQSTTLECLKMLLLPGTTCASGAPNNAVQVKQTAKVNTFFMKMFGIPTMSVGATATASTQGLARPENVAIIIDTTGSMSVKDTSAGCTFNGTSVSELQCTLKGIEAFLLAVNPCAQGAVNGTCTLNNSVVRVSLFTFPNVLTTVNGSLPKFNGQSVDSISKDINCSGVPGSYSNSTTSNVTQPLAAPYTLPVPGASLPVFTGTETDGNGNSITFADPAGIGHAAVASDQAGLEYLEYTQTASPNSTWTATYQITPFLSDYSSANPKAYGLNSNSALVKAVGNPGGTSASAVPGCLTYTLGIYGNGNGSGFGNTYFAGAIYAAQAALTAERNAIIAAGGIGGDNAIIMLTDGQANASYFNKNSSAYENSKGVVTTTEGTQANQFPEGSFASAQWGTSEVGPQVNPPGMPSPYYLTPAYISPAFAALGYDTLSSDGTTVTAQPNAGRIVAGKNYTGAGQSRSGNSPGIYPDWNDQCQQAITAAQWANSLSPTTTVYSVAYGAESTGCNSSAWSIGYTDNKIVAIASAGNPALTLPTMLPCTTMQNIASSPAYFYSDSQQSGGGVDPNCTSASNSLTTTVNGVVVQSLQEIFQAIGATITSPRLVPNDAPLG